MTTAHVPKTVLGLWAAFAIALTSLVAPSSPAQADENEVLSVEETGCPRGAVCIYPSLDYNGGNPTYVFWSYGVHKIYDQYGWHLVLNNQTDGAYAWLCKGSDGTYCDIGVNHPREIKVDLTPINAVRLASLPF